MKKLLLNVVLVFLFVASGHMNAGAQGTYNMCTTTSTTDSTGTLYDSGGPNDVYQVSEDCTLLVAPSCATSITLTFQYFATESGWDYFHVYDGPTTAAPELLNTSGATLPGPITCTSGYMLLVFHSDFTIVDSGFIATWTSVIAPSVAPTAAFTMSNTNPPLGVDVQFTNTSVGGTTGWLYDFGDGDTARSENPTHHYTAPGTYTVSLIAFQCSETDTITHTITVQAAPHISVTPLAGFTASVTCGDSANFTMNVANTGGGQLVYSTDGSIVGAIKVLAMTYGTNQFVEFPRTIAAINQHFTNYTLTTTGTIDPGILSGQLIGQNVLLIPEQQNNTGSNVWQSLGPVIQQYLNNGGSVVFCGSASSLSDNLFVTGVFTGSFVQDVAGFQMDVVAPLDPLAANVAGPTFNAPSSTFAVNITNPNKVNVVGYMGNDIVTYRYYGSGKAIYIAFDYFASNNETSQIIANAIEWGGQNALPQWIHLSLQNDTVTAPQSHPVGVTFVASSLPAGTYYANIGIGSNDPANPLVAVPCTLTVSGLPIIALSDNCLHYDSVMQYTTVRDTVRILNTGCDTLKFSSIVCTNPVFTLTPSTLQYLLPGAFADIAVTLHDTVVGPVTGSININNNDTNLSVCLTATIFPAPKTSTTPTAITESLRACGDSGTVTFEVTNSGIAGAGHLIYHLGALPTWVSASPTTGDLAQGASATITLSFGSSTMVGGNYYTNISIISNDPKNPTKLVPCTLSVDSNPCVDFSVVTNTCTGFATFTTTTINNPTSYLWDFGDGDTSTLANPSHPYPHNGTYTATLIACNSRGCDTVIQTVNAIITGPRPISCYPATLNYCCGIGVVTFQIFDGTGYRINNASNDAVDGYKDYTCTDTATLVTNFAYNINVTTGFSYEERVRMWVDMNNDAYFDTLTELVYDSTNLINHGGTFTLPDYPSNVFNEPVRVRVASDYSGNPTPEPCLDLQFGQVEDYSIFISPINSVKNINSEVAFSVYPNPFNQSTSIEYNLKNSSKVTVEVHNILGEQVTAFAKSELQSAGKHTYQFGGQPSGVYFVKVTIDGKSNVQKIVKM